MTVDRRTLLAAPLAFAAAPLAARERDVPYVPTPPELVEAMLDMAKVTAADQLIDLGSGDGRIPLAAARRGATALGVEIDGSLVAKARAAARAEGLEGRASFRTEDLFTTPIRDATVVTLYLLPAINLRLRPRLLVDLAAGTRVVAHAFDMAEWAADRAITVDGRNAYLWVVPAVAGGEWLMMTAAGGSHRLSVEQRFQRVVVTLDGVRATGAELRGAAFGFTVRGRRYEGRVGDTGIVGDGWSATRA